MNRGLRALRNQACVDRVDRFLRWGGFRTALLIANVRPTYSRWLRSVCPNPADPKALRRVAGRLPHLPHYIEKSANL